MNHLKFLKLAVLCTVLTTNPTHSNEPAAENERAADPWKANEQLVANKSSRQSDFNYVESRVPQYDLPNPLIDLSGNVVSTDEQWSSSRREELLELFREHVYGRRPTTPFRLRFEVVASMGKLFNDTAVGHAVNIVVTVEERDFSFPVTVFVPTNRKGPVPAAVLINNRYHVSLKTAIEKEDPFWPVQLLIQRGYATACFHTSAVDPDKPDGYAEGIRAFFKDGEPPADNDWRCLSSWGWAASRVLDYLETVDSVDAKRVAVIGHSRGGKSALWAACEDERFAIAYSNNSGCGGAALSRRAYGETVKRITTVFPHWFAKNFAAYSGREDQLPVDQHEVFALIAPRRAYVASADQDLWADPKGEYASLVSAAPVFKLLGSSAITKPTMPPLNQPRVSGQTGYHIRSGGHNLTAQDWNWFLDFAELKTTN